MRRRHRRGARGNRWLAVASLLLAGAGAGKILSSVPTAAGPPRPAADTVGHAKAGTPFSAAPPSRAGHAPLAYAVPTHIDIPGVAVHADIIRVALNPDGTLGVPPLDQAQVAGWYDRDPAPGQAGTAIIDAHVDSAETKAFRGAFYTLGKVRPGQEIDVTRSDHTVAVFTVDSIELVPKSHFPTAKVYGRTAYPGLRLITCGGDFDDEAHSYVDNTIVYGHLTGARKG
jgi:Sortase domain